MVPWIATYRLQLLPTFGFPEVQRLVPYLSRLGISHLYLSPILEARTGSTHGYDGTDPRVVRREFGGEAAFRELAKDVHAAGMGILLDIVPNHLAVSTEGEPVRDVLELGEASPFARWFDVDWAASGVERRLVVPWLGAGGKRNYRRYLDIDDLIGVRIEDAVVFDETHAKVIELAHDGLIDGVRVDHLDGLADPVAYLARLKDALPATVRVFVETIEEYTSVATTGYDALAAITETLLQRLDVAKMKRAHESVVGPWPPNSSVRVAVERVVDVELANECARVVEEIRRVMNCTIAEARDAFIGAVMDEEFPRWRDAQFRAIIDAPAAARVVRYARSKAIEDTYFYRDRRVLVQNELGSSPLHRSGDPRPWKALERLCGRRIRCQAESLTSTSTHDTKRSEDARARLLALNARATEFAEIVKLCHAEFVAHGGREVDLDDAWYVLQELVAMWSPGARDTIAEDIAARLEVVVVKAAREAKQRSSWAQPNETYEAALRRFVRYAIDPNFEHERITHGWGQRARTFFDSIAHESVRFSLAQVLLKTVLPGVPDFYQGHESIQPLLVDPDNRRPVDYIPRLAAIESLDRIERSPRHAQLARLVEDADVDRLKLFVTRELLRFRKEWREFLLVAPAIVHAYYPEQEEDEPPALVLRRSDGKRDLCAIVSRVPAASFRDARPLRLPYGVTYSRHEWFSHRIFDADADLSMHEILEPLGMALLVSR